MLAAVAPTVGKGFTVTVTGGVIVTVQVPLVAPTIKVVVAVTVPTGKLMLFPVPAVGPMRITWPGASGGRTGSGIGAGGSACEVGTAIAEIDETHEIDGCATQVVR